MFRAVRPNGVPVTPVLQAICDCAVVPEVIAASKMAPTPYASEFVRRLGAWGRYAVTRAARDSQYVDTIHRAADELLRRGQVDRFVIFDDDLPANALLEEFSVPSSGTSRLSLVRIGPPDAQERAALYKGANCYVTPARAPDQPTPFGALEAIAAGCPIRYAYPGWDDNRERQAPILRTGGPVTWDIVADTLARVVLEPLRTKRASAGTHPTEPGDSTISSDGAAPDRRVRAIPGVVLLEAVDEAALHDVTRDQYFGINGTGARLWTLLIVQVPHAGRAGATRHEKAGWVANVGDAGGG